MEYFEHEPIIKKPASCAAASLPVNPVHPVYPVYPCSLMRQIELAEHALHPIRQENPLLHPRVIRLVMGGGG